MFQRSVYLYGTGIYSVPEECLSKWILGIWCSRGVFIYMEQVYNVPEECLSMWNRYIVFHRSVYQYGTGIWC